MKKIILKSFLVIFAFSVLTFKVNNTVSADWWSRSDVRPTQPSFPRDEIVSPTSVPDASPTPKITTPSMTPAPTAASGSAKTGGGSNPSIDDPCASGKSYVGPYCGWSPSVGGNSPGGNSGSNNSSGDPRIGGPNVKGLSYTGSGDLGFSDIILLAGVLCLLLYVRSKLVIKRSI